MTMITGRENIRLAQMLAQKGALKLETLGMKHSGGSVCAMIKRHYGLKGNKQRVYTQFCELIEIEKENRNEEA